MEIKHLNIQVFGRVQGVSFRAHTQDKAESLGLAGFVCNEADGSVYVEAEGAESALADLVRWLRQGPPMANVVRVEVAAGALRSFYDFRIAWSRRG